MHPMLKHGWKMLGEDKQLQQMYKDFEKLEKELKETVKQMDALKKKWQ